MDKYEYKLRADEIKTLIGEGRYAEAVQIADTIDWNKVKSVRMLCTISDIYKINRRYEESREILLIANRYYPEGRYIIYSLCELSIKLQDIVHAIEYFKEFVRIAPHNTSRYILQYKLYVAQDVSLEERIAVLQEFKKHDYREKWGYELAFLYHRVGLTTECVEECDELFLWFGGGRYVMKALELKALHETLSPEQQKVYDRYRAGMKEPVAALPGRADYDEERDEMGHDEPEAAPRKEDGEFHVKTVDLGQYNTINLQQVIAESLKELQKPAQQAAEDRVSQDTQVMDGPAHPGLHAGKAGMPRPDADAGAVTKVMGDAGARMPVREQAPAQDENMDSTADTGVLGITEEDLNAFDEGNESAFADSFKRTAQSIATDDTIWMPSIPEMARYAAEQEFMAQPAEEISARTIKQATGEIPMAEPLMPAEPNPLPDPVQEALRQPPVMPPVAGPDPGEFNVSGYASPYPMPAQGPVPGQAPMPVPMPIPEQMPEPMSMPGYAPVSTPMPQQAPVYEPAPAPMPQQAPVYEPAPALMPQQAPVFEPEPMSVPLPVPVFEPVQAPIPEPSPAMQESSAEQRLLNELQNEAERADEEARRMRAAERRAELRSREKSGRIREVSSDTRRMGQTRKYTPIAARMDKMVEAALSDKDDQAEEGRVPVAIPREEILSRGEGSGHAPNVIYPSRNRSENGYDSLLSQGADGQYTMAVDERTELERQITGQISINDFLTGWEDYRKEQQARQMDNVRENIARRTDEMFREYDESEKKDLQHQLEMAQEEAIRREREGAEDAYQSDEYGAPDGEEAAEVTTDISDDTFNLEVDSSVFEDGSQPAGSAEEEEPGRDPEDVSENDGQKEERRPSREEIAHQLAVLEGRIAPDAPSESLTAEADEKELIGAEGEAAQPAPDAVAVEDAMQAPDDGWEEMTNEEEGLPEEQEYPSEEGEYPPEEQEYTSEAEEYPPEEQEDAQEEQAPDGAQPDDYYTGNSARSTEETEYDALRVMTPEEKELFGPYIHKKRSRQQIVNAIDRLSLAAYTGNAVITGEEGAGTINLAKGLIRSVQLTDSNFSGQIAKISGRAMNRKRVDAIVDKLSGGALIVQGAAGMNNETTKALLKSLDSENRAIIVILEDTRRNMEKYLKKHPELQECFPVRVDVEALATKELVAYARQYARDKEFSMDEFAVLALHKRIDEMQTADHEVTIAEVREIMDGAIQKASRKNPGHFFDILLQKRYDEEDMIVLREKDMLR